MKKFILLVATIFTLNLEAQDLNWRLFHGEPRFYSIAIDSEYIWLGTNLGAFKIHKETETSEHFNSLTASFPNNFVTDIEIDGQGRVWAALGDDKGKGLMMYDQGQWTHFPEPIIKDARLYKDCSGNIWVTPFHWYGPVFFIENGVIQDRTAEFSHYEPLVYCTSDNQVGYWREGYRSAVHHTPSGIITHVAPDSLWQFPSSEGIFYIEKTSIIYRFETGGVLIELDYSNGSSSDYPFHTYRYFLFENNLWKPLPIPFNPQNPVSIYHGRQLFFAGEDGKLYYDQAVSFLGQQVYQRPTLANAALYKMEADGTIWYRKQSPVNLDDQHLIRVSNGIQKIYPSLANSQIKFGYYENLAVSGGGKIAMTTQSGETIASPVALLEGLWSNESLEYFEYTPGGVEKMVENLQFDLSGNIYLEVNKSYGSDCALVYQKNQNWVIEDHIGRDFCFEPNSNNFWYLDKDNQLFRRTENGDTGFNAGNTPTLPPNGFKDIFVDGQNTLWAHYTEIQGDSSDLYKRYENGQWEVKKIPIHLGYYSNLFIDKTNQPWIWNGYNVWRYDGVNWQDYHPYLLEPYTHNMGSVYYCSIVSESADKIWIGTTGLGAFSIDVSANEFKHINLLNCSEGDPIGALSIAIDSFGNKWFGTKHGLAVFQEDGLLLDSYEVSSTENLPLVTAPILSISPNPAQGDFSTISLQNLHFEPHTVQVINLQGQILLDLAIHTNKENFTIQNNDLSPGLYLVRVLGEGKSICGKLMVLH